MLRPLAVRFAVFLMLELAPPAFSQERPSVPGDTVSVIGNVRNPGVYPVGQSGTTTVRAALAQAGGLFLAEDQTAYIYRADAQGAKHEIQISLSSMLNPQKTDITLYRGDILFVPAAGKKPAPRNITSPDHIVAGST